MSTSKAGKNQWADSLPQKKNPFELPRLITRQIKQCAEAHAEQAPTPVESVKYLWMDFDASVEVRDDLQDATRRPLNTEEWKNVIDEAASLGVRSAVINVGPGLSRSQDLWDVCLWAQRAHDMTVSLFVNDPFDLDLLQDVSRLDMSRACLLVPKARFQEAQPFIDAGIKVCVADVGRDDHATPCNGPRNLVYVGARGKLYPCGLVDGNEHYLLGDVLEDPLAPIRSNDALPWAVSEGDCQGPGNCNACPNIMDKRMYGLNC